MTSVAYLIVGGAGAVLFALSMCALSLVLPHYWPPPSAPLPSGMRYSDGLRILQHAGKYLDDRDRLHIWAAYSPSAVLMQATLDVLDAQQAQLRPDAVPNVCAVPPAGWSCTREPGHAGPCAAWPDLGTVAYRDEMVEFEMGRMPTAAADHLNQDGEVD